MIIHVDLRLWRTTHFPYLKHSSRSFHADQDFLFPNPKLRGVVFFLWVVRKLQIVTPTAISRRYIPLWKGIFIWTYSIANTVDSIKWIGSWKSKKHESIQIPFFSKSLHVWWMDICFQKKPSGIHVAGPLWEIKISLKFKCYGLWVQFEAFIPCEHHLWCLITCNSFPLWLRIHISKHNKQRAKSRMSWCLQEMP